MHAVLERTDHEVEALVRADDDAAATARVRAALAGIVDDPEPLMSRVRAVRGDVAASGLGLASSDRARLLAGVTHVLHAAASVRFDAPLDAARAANRDAVAEVLALAGDLRGLQRLVHVSTAYVCGDWPGVFTEDDVDRGQRLRNSYEQSKLEGELLVHAARRDGLPACVARPSMIVGESGSGWTSSFNVVYGPLRLWAIGALGEGVPYAPTCVLDMVPLDYVTDALVHLLLDEPDPPPVAALVAGRHALTLAEIAEATARADGTAIPRMDTGVEAPPEIGELLPYGDVRTRFDDRRARDVLEPVGIVCPELAGGFASLVRYGRRVRWGRRPITREAARRLATSEEVPA